VLDLARDVVRRGLEEAILDVYRIGQNVAWRAWMAPPAAAVQAAPASANIVGRPPREGGRAPGS